MEKAVGGGWRRRYIRSETDLKKMAVLRTAKVNSIGLSDRAHLIETKAGARW